MHRKRNPGIEGRGSCVAKRRRMAATAAATATEAEEASAPPPAAIPSSVGEEEELEGTTTRPWIAYSTEDLKRTVFESTDSAIRSARSLQENSSTHLRTLQDLVPQLKIHYRTYEDAFFKKFKDELMSAREHPAMASGVAVAAAFIFMRGPRRFLFRHTLGRLQSEEAQYVRAEKNVKELYFSVDLMKLESKKLLERSALAEKEMKHGQNELKNAGSDIQRLVKSVYKIESQAADLMDGLREIPGREALKLRAEVASMASLVRQQRKAVDKRITKISELGVAV